MVEVNSNIGTQVLLQDGALIVNRYQDCTPIAEFCKAAHKEGLHGSSEFRHAAKIPDVMVEKYCNDNNITFAEFMQNKEHIRRVLNDPAMAHFRIWPGRV